MDTEDFTIADDAQQFQIPDTRTQQRILASRRRLAEKLMDNAMNTEGKMIGRHYVAKSPWASAAEGFASGYLGSQADAEEADQARQLRDVQTQLLRRLPGNQQDAARMALTPGLERIGQTLIANQTKPHDPAAPIAQTDAEGVTRLYDRQGNLIRELGKVGKPGADASHAPITTTDDKGNVQLWDRNGNPIKSLGQVGRTTQPPSFQFVPTDQGIQAVNPKSPTSPPINTGLQPPPSAATTAGRREATTQVNAIDDALDAVKTSPGAFGLPQGAAGSTELGATLLNQFSTKGEIAARARVANIGSAIVHDRSGANVTISEAPRLKPFIPSASDSADTVTVKLNELRRRMEQDGYSFGLPAGSLAAPKSGKTITRTVKLKDGRTGVEYSDGSRGYK